MKKLILSLCALCLAVGMVSAQNSVKTSPVSAKAQAFENAIMQQMEAKAVMNTTKFDSDYWTELEGHLTPTEPYWNWDGYYGISWVNNVPDEDLTVTLDWTKSEQIWWCYGTGFLMTFFGSGEVGYSFRAGEGSYYELQAQYPQYGYPYGAKAYIVRAPSTSRTMRIYDEDGNWTGEYKGMPVYFKLYNQSKVKAQRVIAGITQYAADGYVDVVYPIDPADFTAITPVGYFPVPEPHGGYAGSDEINLEFVNVGAPDLLGDNFSMSIVFPVELGEPDEDGFRNPTDESFCWNAFWMPYNNGVSSNPHCVYNVIDWEKQSWWSNDEGTNLTEKFEEMVEDQADQPNPRYSVIPYDAYAFSNSTLTSEPVFMIYWTEKAALESANHADRYVQVMPNPAVDYANFKSYGKMQKIEIFSMNGKLMKSVNGINAEEYNLSVSGLKSGMYVARITGENGVSTKKLVVR